MPREPPRPRVLVVDDERAMAEMVADGLADRLDPGADGERYAQIRKTWAGLRKELLTSSDHYTVTFTGPVSPSIRTMIVMVPVVLDMSRHGPY